jgi:flagellar biosynthesis protein FlhB
MAGEDDGKTEEPTQKRLTEAREKGDIPQSGEVRLWASLVSAFIIITMLPGTMGRNLSMAMVPLLERPHTFTITIDSFQSLLRDIGLAVLSAVAMPFAVVIVVSLIAALIQNHGFMWVPNKLFPDFNRINPMAGFKKMFGAAQGFELLKQIIKLVVVGTLLVWVTWPHVKEYRGLSELELPAIITYLEARIYTLVLAVLMVATVLTGGDYAFQLWRFMEKMKMSKQEVKDEHKQQEGDPLVKGKIRQLRAKRARTRMMAAVPSADVIVTNPTHFAVALKYDMDTMPAPILVAKGADLVAKRIRDLAEQHEIPLVENPPLARALFAAVELDQEIPPEHYKAVAEVIGYVMRIKGQIAK